MAGDAVGDVVANSSNAGVRTSDKLKQGATSMMNTALDTVIHGTKVDVSAQWWVKAYSYSAGLGLVLLVGGLWFSLGQYSLAKDPTESVQEIFGWALFAMLGMTFGPLVIYLWAQLTGALEDGILTMLRTDQAGWKSSLMHPLSAMSMTGNGEVWGWVMCILAILAGMSIWVSYLLQTVVIYIGGVLTGFAEGAMAHRSLRRNAIQVILLVISLLLMRPVFLLILFTCSLMSAHFNEMTTLKQTSTDGFVALGLSLTVMLVVALAPFKLLKFSPVKLDGGASASIGDGHQAAGMAGSLAMGAVGAGIGAVLGGGAGAVKGLSAARPTVRGSSRDRSSGSSSGSATGSEPAPAPTMGGAAPAPVGDGSGGGDSGGGTSGGGAPTTGGTSPRTGGSPRVTVTGSSSDTQQPSGGGGGDPQPEPWSVRRGSQSGSPRPSGGWSGGSEPATPSAPTNTGAPQSPRLSPRVPVNQARHGWSSGTQMGHQVLGQLHHDMQAIEPEGDL